eukprot:TRINITY_DN94666_c0_g1_i1.p1 TRINITY_DN94666_c0_g1~~TRINITY_DN94666_c0_g1_i1.p1  ORF type:complete len:257 (+),score=58.91 TRINITY_DN94666_c0_g1_i1:49-771(+)
MAPVHDQRPRRNAHASRTWPVAYERLLARFPDASREFVAEALLDAGGHAGRAAGVLRAAAASVATAASASAKAEPAVGAAFRSELRQERARRRSTEQAATAEAEMNDAVDQLVNEGRRVRQELQAALAEVRAEHQDVPQTSEVNSRGRAADTRQLLEQLEASRDAGNRLHQELRGALARSGRWGRASSNASLKSGVEDSPEKLLEQLSAAWAGVSTCKSEKLGGLQGVPAAGSFAPRLGG